jgi:hypothetical protein
VSPVKYELGFYVPEDNILLSHRRENLKSYNLVLRRAFFWSTCVEHANTGLCACVYGHVTLLQQYARTSAPAQTRDL